MQQVVQALHLHLYLLGEAGMLLGPAQAFLQPQDPDVIVLDQNGIGEVEPVRIAPAQKDGLFFKGPKARRGLAGGGNAHSPPAERTHCRVIVDIPLMRARKFRVSLSAWSMARALPLMQITSALAGTNSPSS